MATTKRACD